jgi:DnaJ-class molecular chaperone
MICPECHGAGIKLTRPRGRKSQMAFRPDPCPECNGSGFSYCCSGAEPDCTPATTERDKR